MEPNGGEGQKPSMEKKMNECLEMSLDDSEDVLRIVIPARRPGEPTFYENFALRGIRVDRAEPGLVVCTFKVPPRLTDRALCFRLQDRAGNLSNGAIANLVDVVGSYVTYTGGLIKNVSVDISISYMSTAKLDDRAGSLAQGAIANLVDIVGASVAYIHHRIMNVSVDISVSYMSNAKLDDRDGNLAQGAVANLVDVVGSSVAYIDGFPMNVSVDISISYMSKAKLDDELEITSKMLGQLGQRGDYSGVIVLLRKKATGEVVAEGRHSMFRPRHAPKL